MNIGWSLNRRFLWQYQPIQIIDGNTGFRPIAPVPARMLF